METKTNNKNTASNSSVESTNNKATTNSVEKMAEAYKDIPGWGMDADPDNEPTYPMKKWTGDDHRRLNYEKPEQQPVREEILHSNERPGITRVFGTSTPPSGLSGMLRRYAFKFSENSSKHWFTLVLADRINAIEGIIDDLKRGYIPNIFVERGWKAEWKYNRKGAIQKVAIGAAITLGVAMLITRKIKKLRKA